ncbi:hypothetical protein A2U01_0069553 [Trifolium medium]|uniref:Uncharacterized protein n=1 Tax=Trifolium medium TaxID=97028 RepID=A0A392SK52_9FABA|nr:hypothetical protein [Trifolium medium]
MGHIVVRCVLQLTFNGDLVIVSTMVLIMLRWLVFLLRKHAYLVTKFPSHCGHDIIPRSHDGVHN